MAIPGISTGGGGFQGSSGSSSTQSSSDKLGGNTGGHVFNFGTNAGAGTSGVQGLVMVGLVVAVAVMMIRK